MINSGLYDVVISTIPVSLVLVAILLLSDSFQKCYETK